MTNALRITPAPGTEEDEERWLIARAVAGDQEATRRLYDAHVDRVYRLAYRIAGDRHLASELTQDVFVQLFRALGQFRGESSFATWLHRVATTTCLNAMRRVKRFRTREQDLTEYHQLPARDQAVHPDLRDAVGAAIDALPDHLRLPLVMHTLEGYTHAEIGAALGVAEGTSKARVSEARVRLRQTLALHLEDRP
jgi:RNA polymerase sigma-70 factor (ECF subfamily)